MRKIIGIINPSDFFQKFYVYEDDKQIQTIQTEIENIPNIIFKLSSLYNINQIALCGSKAYNLGIAKNIQKEEKNKYQQNKLIITYI